MGGDWCGLVGRYGWGLVWTSRTVWVRTGGVHCSVLTFSKAVTSLMLGSSPVFVLISSQTCFFLTEDVSLNNWRT